MLDRLTTLLADAPHVYVAVTTRSGPHVTPELFTASGGRLVCLTSVVTLKAKVVPGSPVVGFAARSGSSAITGVGTAEVVDPASPSSVARGGALSATAPLGVARFVRDNAAELAGATVDALLGKLGSPLPPHRVLLAITPTAFAVVEGDEVTEHDGWSEPSTIPAGAPIATTVDLAGVPSHLAELVDRSEVVVGWSRTDGSPLALPARWDQATATATVPTALLEISGAAASSPAAVTFDTWSGFGPSGKQGLMLRGSGHATAEGATASLSFAIDRVTHWDGVATATS